MKHVAISPSFLTMFFYLDIFLNKFLGFFASLCFLRHCCKTATSVCVYAFFCLSFILFYIVCFSIFIFPIKLL